MSVDNTMVLVSRLKYLMEQYLVESLQERGYKGIIPSHGKIILVLSKNKSLKMNEIASYIDKDPSTVTSLVKKLQKQDLVSIYQDAKDKRAYRVELTNNSEKLLKDINVISENLYSSIYLDVSNKEREIFRKVLKKMIVELEK